MSNISVELGSIYSSLDLKLDKFESSVTKALQGFYKLQTGTEKASSIMDTSVNTAASNIEKSYRLLEHANERTGKSIFDNSKKIDSFKQQLKLLDDEIKKSDEILGGIEKQCGKNSEEAETYKSRVLDLKLSHAQFTDELKKAERETGTFAGRLQLLEKEFGKIDDKYKAFDKVGDKFKSVGNKLTMGVTLPIVGAGTAATKFAFDFEKSSAKVSTIADTTKVSMDTLKKGVVDLSNQTGMSTTDLNDALYQSISAGVDTTNSIGFLSTAVKTAKAGFADTETAVDSLTTVLNAYGMKATDVTKISDQMMEMQNFGKTTFAEAGASIGNVIPIASSLNVSTKDLFASMAVLTKNGIKTSEAVTGLKAAYSNILKPSDEASKMAKSLGLEFNAAHLKSVGWAKFLDEAKQKTGGNAEKMAQLFGSVEALNSVMVLTGKGAGDFNIELGRMNDVAGLTDKSFKKVSETTEAKFHKSLNKAKNSAMEMGIKLLPMVEKGTNLISKLTDKFNGLSPSMQNNIIEIGIASAALGPFIGGIGTTIRGVTGLLKTGKKIGVFFGTFNKGVKAAKVLKEVGTATELATGTAGGGGILGLAGSLGTTIGPFLPWIAGAAAVAAAGYGIYKVLNQKTIPEVDLFADKVEYTSKSVSGAYGGMAGQVETNTVKIRDSTKKALGSYMDLDDKATKALMSLKFNSETITAQNSKTVTQTYNDMTTQITGTMDKKFQEQYTQMENNFKETSTLTDKEEAEILKKKTENYKFQKKVVEDGNKQIQEIIKNAIKEHGKLTDEDYRVINNIRQNMQTDAVKIMSKGEKEQMVIMERLRINSGNITAKQAADVIKNSAKARNSAVADAEKKYNDTVAWVTLERDVNHTISKDKADKIIKAAERERDDSIAAAETKHRLVVEQSSKQCSESIKNIDIETGEVIKVWQRTINWFKDNPVTRYFKKKDEEIGGNIRELQNRRTPDAIIYGPRKNKPMNAGYATGTESATPGLHEIAENGFEIVSNRQYRWFNCGEKVFNNAESKKLLSSLVENKSKSENIAKEAMVGAKESISVKPRISVSESTMKSNSSNMLNWGTNNKKAYKNYTDFVNKLNADEVKRSKELLDKDYKNRVQSIDNRLKATKTGSSKSLAIEKDNIKKQIAYYQNLAKKTKNKSSKKHYAEKIAQLRKYQQQHTKSSKNISQSEVQGLENSKKALKKYHDLGMDLLKKRSETVKKSIKTSENLFKDKMNIYDEAIRRLSIDTKDLNKNLDNQRGIVILQEQKIGDLKKRYKELAQSLGSISEEAINAKKAFEDAKTGLISMSNAVEECEERIKSQTIDSINSLTGRIKNALKQRYDDELKKMSDVIDDKFKKLEDDNREELKLIEDKYASKIKLLDNALKAEEKAEKDAEENKKINQFKEAIEYEHNEFNKAELQKELNNTIKERDKRLHIEQIQEQKEKLQEAKENEIEVLNKRYKLDVEYWNEKRRIAQKTHEDMTKDTELQLQAEKVIMDNNQKEIVELLHSYGHDYEQAGQSLGERLVTGFKPRIEELKSMLSSVQASFEEARTSALNAMVAQSAMVYSIPSGNTSNSTTNNNSSTTTNHNNFTFNSPKALSPSEMRHETESNLRRLAFIIA